VPLPIITDDRGPPAGYCRRGGTTAVSTSSSTQDADVPRNTARTGMELQGVPRRGEVGRVGITLYNIQTGEYKWR